MRLRLPQANLFYYVFSFVTLIGIVLSFILSTRFLLQTFKKAFTIDEKVIQAQAVSFDITSVEAINERLGGQ